MARARAGDGPSLVEARTYRLAGHWASDRALYRVRGELDEWVERDPIGLFEARLAASGVLDADAAQAAWSVVKSVVEAAFQQAERDPSPGPDELAPADVYA